MRGPEPDRPVSPLELVLADGTRVPLVREISIGRGAANTLRIADTTVSRRHARIVAERGAPTLLEDTGSERGTYLDGRRIDRVETLHEGARIRIGDATLSVEGSQGSARTVAIREGASLVLPPGGEPAEIASLASDFGANPRVSSGFALKRLARDEGARRWVLSGRANGSPLHLSDNDVQLFSLLDGENSLVDLIGEAEQRFGSTGPHRLAALLGELGERGLLERTADRPVRGGFWRGRERVVPGLAAAIDRFYRVGGRLFFLRPVLIVVGLVAAAGIPTMLGLIVARYGTPFVVAHEIGPGILTFIPAWFAVGAVHALAQGLTMVSFGRSVQRAGVRRAGIFPSVFVDTSDAWFEPRRQRMLIGAAGSLSDLALGAVFALSCLWLEDGTVRDVCFQLALAAYAVALYNLNPFVERDGYHLLVDLLGEPGLRRRAAEQLSRRLSGVGRLTERPVLGRYAAIALVWAVVVNLVIVVGPLRYYGILQAVVPGFRLWQESLLLAALWLAFFGPVIVVLVRPLLVRVRGVQPAR